MLFVNSMINNIGVVESATFGVGIRIDDIVNKLSQGIQQAAMPMISQNIGAGEQKRSKHTVYWAWVFSFGFTVVCMILYVLLGKQMFMLFSDDPLVHGMSGVFIKAILWMFPAFAVMRGSGAFVQGIGNARLSMILALLDGVIDADNSEKIIRNYIKRKEGSTMMREVSSDSRATMTLRSGNQTYFSAFVTTASVAG